MASDRIFNFNGANVTFNDIHDNNNCTIYASEGKAVPDEATATILIPHENNYNEVREYIEQKKQTDAEFKSLVDRCTKTQLAEELTKRFGWFVDAHSLTVNLNRH